MKNVPPVLLVRVNQRDAIWKDVNLKRAGWQEGAFLCIVKWIDGIALRPEYVKTILLAINIPSYFRSVS